MRLVYNILASLALLLTLPSIAFANKPTDGGYWLQDAATPVMEELTKLHNFVFWIMKLFIITQMNHLLKYHHLLLFRDQ